MVVTAGTSGQRGSGQPRGSVQDVRVDHRGADIVVTEKFLHGPDVVVVLEQVRGKGMTQGMRARALCETRGVNGFLHRAPEDGFVEVVTDRLPDPCAAGVGILPGERRRKLHPARARGKIAPVVNVLDAQPTAFHEAATLPSTASQVRKRVISGAAMSAG